jgi:epoxide hydrolase-like predicted phosphatase
LPAVAIEAVLFDVGGVLERNPPTGWQRRWAARLGLQEPELERRLAPIWARGSLGQRSLQWVQRRLAQTLALAPGELRLLMSEVWQEYVGTLDTELAGWFAALRPRYRTGIISNSFVGAREHEQAAHGLQDLCDVIVYSHEVGVMKPDRRIFEIACERLAVAPQHAVFLDDVPQFAQAARALGMRALTFTDTRTAIAELQRLLTENGDGVPGRASGWRRRTLP